MATSDRTGNKQKGDRHQLISTPTIQNSTPTQTYRRRHASATLGSAARSVQRNAQGYYMAYSSLPHTRVLLRTTYPKGQFKTGSVSCPHCHVCLWYCTLQLLSALTHPGNGLFIVSKVTGDVMRLTLSSLISSSVKKPNPISSTACLITVLSCDMVWQNSRSRGYGATTTTPSPQSTTNN